MSPPFPKPAALAALMLSALLALTGCITAPAEPAKTQALTARQLGLGGLAAPKIDARWWQAFGDPQLDRIMARALAGSPTLAEAMARVRHAQAVSDATQAGLSPSVSYDFDDSRQRLSRNFIIPPPYAGTLQWYGSQGFNLSWDLDFWGRQASLLKQAQAATTALGLDVAGARLALAGAVLQAYVDLDRQFRLADIAARSAQQRADILAITRKRVDAGLDTQVELQEAEGAVPQAELARQQAELARALAVHRLAALAGEGAEGYDRIQRPTLKLDAAPALPARLPADLLSRRPDVLAARARIEAATAGQAAAKAAFYPDVNLTAFIGTSALGFTKLFEAASGGYGSGPAIHLPIFDAGRLKAQYRAAGAEIDAAVAAYNDAVLNAVRETADPLTSLSALADQLATQQRAYAAAQAAYRLARERYDAGLTNYLTVLNADSERLATERQRVELESAQALNRVALLLALGGSFEPPADSTGAPRRSRPADFPPSGALP